MNRNEIDEKQALTLQIAKKLSEMDASEIAIYRDKLRALDANEYPASKPLAEAFEKVISLKKQ